MLFIHLNLKEGLLPYLTDNAQSWVMNKGGDYRRKRSRKKGFSAQSVSYTHLTLPTSDLV